MSVVRSTEGPLLGGSLTITIMLKSIGALEFVRCWEVVRF